MMSVCVCVCVCVCGLWARLSTNVQTDKFFTASCVNDMELETPEMYKKIFVSQRNTKSSGTFIWPSTYYDIQSEERRINLWEPPT
jgi:hypothetical protein